MSQKTVYENYLADSYALAYMHSSEVVNMLPLILSRFKIHVSVLSLHEFLSYTFYKTRDPRVLTQLCSLMFKFYVVENLNVEVLKHSAMLLADLLKHGITANAIDVFNASIAMVNNLVVLTDDVSRYNMFTKYGLIAMPIKEFFEKFKNEVLRDRDAERVNAI
ncbi:MAG: hypothetical protein QXP03_00340 [Desulfurococcaceae archaeon]